MDIASIISIQAATHVASEPALPQRAHETQEIIQAVRAVNAGGSLGENNELTFVFERNTRRPIMRIVNRETGEVVIQVPDEYVLRMAAVARRQAS